MITPSCEGPVLKQLLLRMLWVAVRRHGLGTFSPLSWNLATLQGFFVAQIMANNTVKHYSVYSVWIF